MPVAELLKEEKEVIDYSVHELPQGFELIDGELVEMPEMAFDSSYVAGEIFGELRSYLKSHAIGITVPQDTSFQCFPHRIDQIRKPDAAVILCDLRAVEWTVPHSRRVPAIIVEVVSPNDRVGDLDKRIDDFLKAGTKLAWVIKPESREAIVYYPDFTVRRIAESGELNGEDVLPGFFIPLASILPPLQS